MSNNSKNYPKLVRDKIPEIIRADGYDPKFHIADDKEYVGFLLLKLIEEAKELNMAVGPKDQKEELADVFEVLGVIVNTLGFSSDEIEESRLKKLEERGGFSERIILDSILE
jgi:predicted house-cleaning noncanonical NTP pyrophosphatase (MazG superfamily)